MLEVINITKYFSRTGPAAVDDISFTVKPGEVAALLGENGAGKTTALRIISGTLMPDRGRCLVDSFDTVRERRKAAGRLGLLLGGETGLYDRLTARENISYFADLHGVPRMEKTERINRLTAVFGMENYLDRRCSTFSRGMKQKTAFARAVIHNPGVILLDEPSTGMDVSSSLLVRDFILSCRAEGRTVLFSSHNIDEVKKLADSIIIIHNGKLAENGSLKGLEEKYGSDLETIYLKLTGQDMLHGAGNRRAADENNT